MLTNKQKMNIVVQAIELISDPNRWIRNIYSTNAMNKYVNPWDAEAVSWCASGACEKFAAIELNIITIGDYYDCIPLQSLKDEINNFCRKKHQRTLTQLNDDLGRAEAIEGLQGYLNVLKEQNVDH